VIVRGAVKQHSATSPGHADTPEGIVAMKVAPDAESIAMSWLLHIHPLRLFNFYLALVFVLTTLLNIHDYRHMVAVARSLPGRWPRLFELLKYHSHIFLNWRTVAPLFMSLGLLLVQLLVTHAVAPGADEKLTIDYLLSIWPVLPVLVITSTAMIIVDVYANWPVLPFDRVAVEKQFDQAEFWLRSWTAPIVHVLSFGTINPRSLVAAEVYTSLLEASKLLNRTLWWTAWQAAFRICCGLSLWLTYALSDWLHHFMYGA
jgi:hypothetical protein